MGIVSGLVPSPSAPIALLSAIGLGGNLVQRYFDPQLTALRTAATLTATGLPPGQPRRPS